MSQSGGITFLSRGLMSQSPCHLKDNMLNDKITFLKSLVFYRFVCFLGGDYDLYLLLFSLEFLFFFFFFEKRFCSLLRTSSLFYWMEYSLEVTDVPFKHRSIVIAVIQEFFFCLDSWVSSILSFPLLIFQSYMTLPKTKRKYQYMEDNPLNLFSPHNWQLCWV